MTQEPDTDTPRTPRLRHRLLSGAAAVGLVVALVAGLTTAPPTLWGLLPILLYAALALLGMDITAATVVSVVAALLVLLPGPGTAGALLGRALADQVTLIGLIIMLGAGVGEVLRATGVAETIVRGVLRAVGQENRTRVVLGVMLACLVLVASLGTLAGALAIAAPVLIPVVARLGFTRSATAAMMFVGGCAGLALAPFAGSNVAIMSAAEVGYLQYLIYGAGPLALLSIAVGLVVVPWVQRRTEGSDNLHGDDLYGESDLGVPQDEPGRRRTVATVAFTVVLVASVAYAIATAAGTAVPLVTLPVMAVVTGLAGGLGVRTAVHFYRGARQLFGVFVLFVLLAVLFVTIDAIKPFDVVLALTQDRLSALPATLFALVIALLGWVGVPGATAAQVVLLDRVFGGLAATVGVGANAWVVVLLFASKADTYGPFPNANMVGAMGMARSQNLRSILTVGWALLLPACIMYALIIVLETR